MVLRNVPSTATFEEQRVEINELAADVHSLTTDLVDDGSPQLGADLDLNGNDITGTGNINHTGQLTTGSILSSAALNNKGSVQFGTVDAYSIGHMPLNSNLAFSQTHGGSYLFYSDASTVELEIASGGITVDGTATFNGNTTIGAPDITNGSTGGVQFFASGQLRIQRDSAGTASDKRFQMYYGTTETASITADGAANFANGGASISSSGTGSFNLLSLKNVSGSIGGSGGVENWIGFKHGSTFGLNLKTAGTNTGYVGVNTTTPANRLDVNHPSSPGIRVGGDGGGGGYHLEMGQVNTNGSPGINATGTSTSLKFLLNNTEVARFNASGKFINVAGAEFGGGVQATSVNLQSSTTASWFQTGTSLGGSDYVWAVKNSSTNTWHGGLKTSSDLYLGGDITSDPKILLNGSNGSASFDETVTIGSGSAAPDDYGLIAYANANTLSNKSAVYARNLADGRNFTGDNSSGATTFEVYASGAVNASDTITAPFIRGDGADGTSADTALFRNLTSGGDNRVRINTYANGGGHPYLKFDAGGSNFVVGEYWQGTTNNQLVLGVGEDPTSVTGISIDGNGKFTHAGGKDNNSGGANLGDSQYNMITAGKSIGPNDNKTFTISGLQSGWMRITGGGYSSAGQSQFAIFYTMGGYMTATSTYDVVKHQEWGAGVTISTTKNGQSYDITLTNNSGSYTLACNFTVESSSSNLKITSN